MLDVGLVQYLAENHVNLLSSPASGHLGRVFSLYVIDCQERKVETSGYEFETFLKSLKVISETSPGSLIFTDDGELEFVNRAVLDCLIRVISGTRAESERDKSDEGQHTGILDRLIQLVDDDSDEGLACNVLSKQLQRVLRVEPASIRLGKERAQGTVELSKYIPVCENRRHAMLLSNYVNIVNNKIVSVQSSNVVKAEGHCPGFVECLKSMIHYVPFLKPQTDLNLGDCSYLDTCHKLNTCRYVHYLQYYPESLRIKVTAETEEFNKQIKFQRGLTFYTHGNCSADASKAETPEQWIQCDVRKFDFSILGKFSAVVADPAWNIHMNLPYGTCNDIELLDLPLNQLQEEGILFLWVTGRAIELGKESLEKWGYKVIHEIAWIKTNQLGRTIVTGRTGHWLNHSKEHLLVGLKGDPQWLNRRLDTDLIVSSTRETSRKPDELYGLIERLVGPHARKLEIFGRDHNLRAGWFTIGNQLSGTNIHELDVKERYENFMTTGPGRRRGTPPKARPQKHTDRGSYRKVRSSTSRQ